MKADVVAGLFPAVPATGAVLSAPTLEAVPARRLKLWELEEKYLCPVIGTCVPMEELVRLAKRFHFSAELHDEFALHVDPPGESGSIALAYSIDFYNQLDNMDCCN